MLDTIADGFNYRAVTMPITQMWWAFFMQKIKIVGTITLPSPKMNPKNVRYLCPQCKVAKSIKSFMCDICNECVVNQSETQPK